jgi:hypothetical protein
MLDWIYGSIYSSDIWDWTYGTFAHMVDTVMIVGI